MPRNLLIASLCLASMTSIAQAQGADPVAAAEPVADPSAPPAPAVTEVAPAPTPMPSEYTGGFRNGFSLSIGQENGSGPSESFSGQLYGFDWRIGMNVNKAIGVYLHSHLSFGTAQVGGASGATGNFAAALVADYTLPFGVFFGGGAGYGVLNNPSGPLAEVRAGYFPFKSSGPGKARRLNVAFDARFYFPGEAIGRVSHLALSLGYDRF